MDHLLYLVIVSKAKGSLAFEDSGHIIQYISSRHVGLSSLVRVNSICA